MSRVRRLRATPLPGSPRSTVSVTLTVTAPVVEGRVTPADLSLWVQHAVSKYHIFRAGFVGDCDIIGGIQPPTVKDAS